VGHLGDDLTKIKGKRMSNSTSKTVLLADDDASILTVLTRALKGRGYKVMASENLSDIDAWVAQGLGDAVVTDVTMPRGNGLEGVARWQASRPELPVIVMSAHNTLLNAARAQDLGAVTFLPKPFDLDVLMDAIEKAVPRPLSVVSRQEEDGVVRISDDLVLVGKSPAMQAVFATLAKLIGNDLTVLITGESGTGKERIARALHALSRRKSQPFVALNMAAIPRELIESALFGHEKGAFTGAHSKQTGAFEQALGGTLFLDEIGDMPMEAQTRLLRVLQEQQVTPIGATRAIKTDVRIVAATHRDLKTLVARGSFREDLYFRLHVVPLALPALRAHGEDIPALVAHFMELARGRGLAPKTLDADAYAALARHDWPGNVRELEHLIYRICALNALSTIRARDIEPMLVSGAVPQLQMVERRSAAVAPLQPSQESIPTNIETFLQTQLHNYFTAHAGGLPAPGLYDRLLARVEKPLIVQTLRATGGNQIKAAEILGLNRNTLRKKMRELGIDAKQLMLRDAA
jgi:two-component system nitrogen regulation response regulator GlnG